MAGSCVCWTREMLVDFLCEGLAYGGTLDRLGWPCSGGFGIIRPTLLVMVIEVPHVSLEEIRWMKMRWYCGLHGPLGLFVWIVVLWLYGSL